MKISHQKIEQILKALASKRRLDILLFIKKNKSVFVTEVAEEIGIRIEAVSQHLRILKAAGIVEYIKRGKYSSYRISLNQDELAKAVLGML